MPSRIERDSERYKARLEKTMADGKVTRQEAAALIRDAKDGHFTQLQAHYLSGFVDRRRRAFDPEARQKLVDFVHAEMEAYATIAADSGRARPAAQPAITEESARSGRVTVDPRPGMLTVDGFGADDPLQGNVGNCYFIASLAAVAKARPELLARAVTTHRDGTYTVRFFGEPRGGGAPVPVSVTIDGAFANQRGRLEYAAARETKELWPMIFEKAYAAWKGGFDQIEAGMAATALSALTGATPDFFPVTAEAKPDELFARLEAACAQGGCVVALSKPWDPSEQGIVADHAYTVLGVERRGGAPFVTLRNPWGEREPGHDGRDDGIFTMPLATFLTSFATVEFARP
jgi:hypothetical protein